MTQELRERVARAIHNVWREQNSRDDDIANYATWDEIEAWERAQILYEADAAIALCMEEAARTAEHVGATTPEDGIWKGAYRSAAAIRALKEGK